MIKAILKRIFGLTEIQNLYEQAVATRGSRNIFESLAEAFNIAPVVSEADLARIPRQGPLLIIANHPTGGLDGVLLSTLLLRVRPDVKVLSHIWFQRFPDLAENMAFIDPSPGCSLKDRKRLLAEATDWLCDGAALLVFPAGIVSFYHPAARRIIDPPWRPGCVRLMRASRATTLPVFTHGRNSLLFQMLCNIHPRVGASRLPWELISQQGRRLKFTIGDPIPFERIPTRQDDHFVTDFLRRDIYSLAHREEEQVDELTVC